MNAGTALKTDVQLAKANKPGMRALDDLAMPSASFSVFGSSPGDTGNDFAVNVAADE